MKKLDLAGRLAASGRTLTFIRFLDDFPFKPYNDIWDDTRQSRFGDPKVYVVQTANRWQDGLVTFDSDAALPTHRRFSRPRRAPGRRSDRCPEREHERSNAGR